MLGGKTLQQEQNNTRSGPAIEGADEDVPF